MIVGRINDIWSWLVLFKNSFGDIRIVIIYFRIDLSIMYWLLSPRNESFILILCHLIIFYLQKWNTSLYCGSLSRPTPLSKYVSIRTWTIFLGWDWIIGWYIRKSEIIELKTMYRIISSSKIRRRWRSFEWRKREWTAVVAFPFTNKIGRRLIPRIHQIFLIDHNSKMDINKRTTMPFTIVE